MNKLLITTLCSVASSSDHPAAMHLKHGIQDHYIDSSTFQKYMVTWEVMWVCSVWKILDINHNLLSYHIKEMCLVDCNNILSNWVNAMMGLWYWATQITILCSVDHLQIPLQPCHTNKTWQSGSLHRLINYPKVYGFMTNNMILLCEKFWALIISYHIKEMCLVDCNNLLWCWVAAPWWDYDTELLYMPYSVQLTIFRSPWAPAAMATSMVFRITTSIHQLSRGMWYYGK